MRTITIIVISAMAISLAGCSSNQAANNAALYSAATDAQTAIAVAQAAIVADETLTGAKPATVAKTAAAVAAAQTLINSVKAATTQP
jgi:outer membrane lipoprotein SlyB